MTTTRSTSVALPEVFSDGDIVLWLQKLELCSTANDWKDADMLKRLPTLLSGKAFAVFERLSAEEKGDYKTLTKALSTAFGGDTTGKHIAMMAFRSRTRKPDEDIQVFAYNLEALLRRAMPNIGNADREVLLQQQFIEGVDVELKKELLQRPNNSYGERMCTSESDFITPNGGSSQPGECKRQSSANNDQSATGYPVDGEHGNPYQESKRAICICRECQRHVSAKLSQGKAWALLSMWQDGPPRQRVQKFRYRK